MKIPHHRRIRMRPQHAAQQIMRGPHVRDPVAHRLVDRIFQRARSRRHAAHFGAQQPHAEHIQLLPPHVFGAHVDDALETQQRADGRSRHAMLSRAGLGDHAMLAHALDQQPLPQAVVDLVRAGVQQVFALQINLRPTQLLGKPPRKKQRRRTPRKSPQQLIQPRLKFLDRASPSRTRAPVLRAQPSESPAHTARRKRQTAPAHSDRPVSGEDRETRGCPILARRLREKWGL